MVVTVGGTSYYINKKNKAIWDKLKDGHLAKKDEDRVYVVDGRERTGKSVWALQQAAYIDPTIIDDLSRITFSPEETLKAIRDTESDKNKTKAIIFDEAFRGLSSKGALSKVNKTIVQAMMEMGQKNLVLFLVSPSFYLLEFYPAVLRSNALFHIAKDKKTERRFYRAFNYNKKAVLYQKGVRKGWGYNVGTKNKDWFPNKYPGGAEFEKRYRDKKAKSIRELAPEEVENTRETKYMNQRNAAIQILYKSSKKVSQRSIAESLGKLGYDITPRQISEICRTVPKKQGKDGDRTE